MEHKNRSIQLLIVDDHQLITDGLCQILQSKKDIAVIHTARNGKEAVEVVTQRIIDCVIMDINMPILNGWEATRQIKKIRPAIKIIVVSMQCDASIVHKMLKAGADAFINKDTGKDELLTAIDKVMKNEKYLSSVIAHILFTTPLERKSPASVTEKQLTERETEIIRHIADGLTNQEIATLLFLSTMTVDTHRKNMLAKLGMKNTASLVKYAADHGLLK